MTLMLWQCLESLSGKAGLGLSVRIVIPGAIDPVGTGWVKSLEADDSRGGRRREHGRYTAETIASRRWLRDQIREMRALTKRLRQL
jgi:hypothetical protein